jgi:hypothetical protein
MIRSLFRDKLTVFLLLAALYASLSYAHDSLKDLAESSFDDFRYYRDGAQLLKEGHDIWGQAMPITAARTQDVVNDPIEVPAGFVRAPHSGTFFLYMLPFTQIPYDMALLLWFILGQAVCICSLWLIVKSFKQDPSPQDWCMAVFLLFSFWPIKEQVHMMQPNFLILGCVAAAAYLLSRGYFFGAGLLFGAGLHLREYLIVAAFYFVIRGSWRVLAGIIISFVGLKLAAIMMWGMPRELSYWRHIFSFFVGQCHAHYNNQTLIASVSRILNGMGGKASVYAVTAAAYIYFLIFAARKALSINNVSRGFIFSLALGLLLTPWVHEHHYLALYPVFIGVWFGLKKPRPIYSLFFVISYLILGLRFSLVRFPQFHAGLPALACAIKITGVIILFFLAGNVFSDEGRYEKSAE